jgi:hypothetical protein
MVLRKIAASSLFTIALLTCTTVAAGAGRPLDTTSIVIGARILAMTSQQVDGSIWILLDHDSQKVIEKIAVPSGAVKYVESVSRQAVALAQSPTGELLLGTANGNKSAVVLYGGDVGNYVATVRMGGPVLAVVPAPTGNIVYTLENVKHHPRLFTFDQTRRGFPFHLTSDASAIASVRGGRSIWIAQSNGDLYRFGFFPQRVLQHIHGSGDIRAMVISPNGQTLYALAKIGATEKVLTYSSNGGSSGSISVPANSVAIALSVSGTQLFDAVTHASSGLIKLLSIRG